jgi:hypothetical protein
MEERSDREKEKAKMGRVAPHAIIDISISSLCVVDRELTKSLKLQSEQPPTS